MQTKGTQIYASFSLREKANASKLSFQFAFVIIDFSIIFTSGE